MPSPCKQHRLEQAQAVKCAIFRRCPLEQSLDSATNIEPVPYEINIAATLPSADGVESYSVKNISTTGKRRFEFPQPRS